mgnify:CR=1 FL=1
MPENVRFRRGSVTLALVFVAAVLLVMLPVGTYGLKRLYHRTLMLRAEQYLDEIMPAAVAGLSPTDLADGQAKFLTISTRSMMTNRFNNSIPVMLQGRLKLLRIIFKTRRLTPDPNHWMGADQPLTQPIIEMQAELTLNPGEVVVLTRALEFFLN